MYNESENSKNLSQSSSKLRQVRKGNAEIQDTPLGLTGIGNVHGNYIV